VTVPHGPTGIQHAPQSRRLSPAVYRRRRLAVFGTVFVVLALLIWTTTVLTLPLPSAAATVTAGPTVSGQAAEPIAPALGSTAAMADGFGDLGWAPTHDVVPIASMTKVITALIGLKAHPLGPNESGPTITFGQADIDQIDAVIAQNGNYADISVGDTTTEQDALYAMLLKSANNIAGSLAIWAYGSMDEFIQQTNAWLTEQGLTDTVVADASGLNPETRSSSSDLITIGHLALADPALAAIVGTKSIELPLFGKLVNGNTLLGTAGITGIKTGTTDEAGSCLLYSATFTVGTESVALYGVTTGSTLQTELQPAVGAFVASLEAGFHETVLADPAVPVATVATAWDTNANIVPATSLTAVTWSDTPVSVAIRLRDIRGGAAGSTVGTISFETPQGTRAVDLVLQTELGDPGPAWRFSHVAQLFG
jgi:D-alanyl-D-alanine carboxypeptidase (penicillin-binding protein 5/6)